MVGEFPELQGFMGRYYALHDGEPREVADAIEAHYRPRFAGDRLPESPIACAVALADKLDALTGLFSIAEAPTGERDPFGLRRAAANKRIGNILKQAETVPSGFDVALMVLPEEKALASTFKLLQPDVDGALRSLDYTAALKQLASLKAPVDAFFDKVMVMDKDPRVRANRIGFLGTLHGTMNRIADLSKLAK